MPRPIHLMRNLGPAMARMLADVDIADEDALRAVGAVDAYRRLKFRFGRGVNATALHAMHAALTDQDWRAVTADEKAQLRAELDAS